MSEMVRQTGTITPFEFSTDNLTIYEMIQELKSAGVDIDEGDSIEYDSITGDGVVVVNGVVYVVDNLATSSPDDGYASVVPNGDGSFDFDTVYYTGSSFLEEQLEQEFDDIDSITLIRDVHDKSSVRVWDIKLEDPKHIKNIARKELISFMINGVSKKAFLEDCTNADVINEAYDSGEFTNQMFYELLTELEEKMRYV